MAKNNEDLKAFYADTYSKGEETVFTAFVDGEPTSEDHPVILEAIDWTGKRVLDVGCGTGLFVRAVVDRGVGHVVGIDYSEEAIAIASKKKPKEAEFIVSDLFSYSGSFDVVVSIGTLEHMDDPGCALRHLSGLADTVIITCPHFINVRGLVWMALATLLTVPMSLSDLHFIHPWDMDKWATEAGMAAKLLGTVDHGWGCGERLLNDFGKRLPNALKDRGLPTEHVEEYLDYLGRLVSHVGESDQYQMDGATAVYMLVRV